MFIRRLLVAYAFTAIVSFLVAFWYALHISPTYTTDAFLLPKEQAISSGQMSGLATASRLLGIGGGDQQSSNFDKFQKYWGSRDVAAALVQNYPDLLRNLFRGDWDAQRNQWYDHPHNFRQYLAVPLNWLFGVYPSFAPSAQDLADYIKGSMKLEADALGNEIQISYNNPDASFARRFLTIVISETDLAVRQAEQRRDNDFATFARDRLEKETNVTYRDALTDAVRQFEISNMYSQAGDHFSFQYVETPVMPINHSSPRPLLYTVIAIIFANLVAACVVISMMLWPTGGLTRRMNAASDYILRLLPRRGLSNGEARARHRAI